MRKVALLSALGLLACGGGREGGPIEVGGSCLPLDPGAAAEVVEREAPVGAIGPAAIHSDALDCAGEEFGARTVCELPSGGRVGIRTPRDLGGFINPAARAVAATFYGARVICTPLNHED